VQIRYGRRKIFVRILLGIVDVFVLSPSPVLLTKVDVSLTGGGFDSLKDKLIGPDLRNEFVVLLYRQTDR
jgi:hypothetical protein